MPRQQRFLIPLVSRPSLQTRGTDRERGRQHKRDRSVGMKERTEEPFHGRGIITFYSKKTFDRTHASGPPLATSRDVGRNTDWSISGLPIAAQVPFARRNRLARWAAWASGQTPPTSAPVA